MFRSRRYRVDNEQLVLFLTVLLVLAVIVLTSTVTFCVSGIFILGMFAISAFTINAHHRALMHSALPVNEIQSLQLDALVRNCSQKLQPGEIDVYLVMKNQLNAYTFGISEPKALVLYTPMVQVMGPGELSFVIGHEMGHVALGHTWLNTILGGMAGIPAPFGAAALLYAAFRWWNRMCEYSADRAGLLACGDLNLAISALVKLVAPNVRSQQEFDLALAMIDAQDDNVSNVLAEAFQSHPMLIRRINKLREYAQTAEYHQMQAGVNGNVGQRPETHRPVFEARQEIHDVRNIPTPPPAEPPKSPEERWPWLKRKDE
ncbi:M48 family metallopeptidase [Chloroflexota bacterium]|nr:M48 family metallopeptidase [Chloroflexota bacterium]